MTTIPELLKKYSREEIVVMYKVTKLRDLSKDLGISTETVYKLLKVLKIRKRGKWAR